MTIRFSFVLSNTVTEDRYVRALDTLRADTDTRERTYDAYDLVRLDPWYGEGEGVKAHDCRPCEWRSEFSRESDGASFVRYMRVTSLDIHYMISVDAFENAYDAYKGACIFDAIVVRLVPLDYCPRCDIGAVCHRHDS